MAWPELIVDSFEATDLDTPDESEWHGLWNTILRVLFLHEERFEITVKPLRQNALMPDWSTFIVSVIASDKTKAPVLFVEVRSRPGLNHTSARAAASNEMHSRFGYFCEALRIPRLYGISAMGPQIAVYEYTLATDCVEGPGEAKDLKTAPRAACWEWDVMSEPGEAKIRGIAEDVKRMIREEWQDPGPV